MLSVDVSLLRLNGKRMLTLTAYRLTCSQPHGSQAATNPPTRTRLATATPKQQRRSHTRAPPPHPDTPPRVCTTAAWRVRNMTTWLLPLVLGQVGRLDRYDWDQAAGAPFVPG
jgi:hypothetical protein